MQTSFEEISRLSYRAADQRISYGLADEQYVELWLPETCHDQVPLVVLIHGGCWLAEYDISHIRPLAAELACNGLAVMALEYRRVGQEGGGWPGTFRDISEALDMIPSLGHPLLDLSSVVLLGHSAGGHLALWASGRSLLNKTQPLHCNRPFIPRGVIGLAAITDLAAYAEGQNSCQKATLSLMGGSSSEEPERYAQASPSQLGTAIPTLLLHGDQDSIVPINQAHALQGVRLVTIEGAGHFDLIHPGTKAFPCVLTSIQELLAT